MRVLGIDPGLSTIGFGVVEGDHPLRLRLVTSGVIRTSKDVPVPDRLLEIKRDLTALLEIHHPDAAAIERIYFNKNVVSAINVAQARGVLLVTLAESSIPCFDYTPQAIKMAVLGYGKGTKAQVQDIVRRTLNLESPPTPVDASDAVAAAMCHHHTQPGMHPGR